MSDNDIKLPDTSKLIVSTSPHFHDGRNVRNIMLTVIYALLPACAVGVYQFGHRALIVLLVTCAACVAFEALFNAMRKQQSTTSDLSALLTGLLLGMNLPPDANPGVCVFGALIAIGIGKAIYGGLGYNIFNPALVARVALLVSFPVALTTWMLPTMAKTADAVTGATPLGILGTIKMWDQDTVMMAGTKSLTYMDLFLGNVGGCIGETSALALLLGGAFLIYKKLIRWQVPIAFIATVALITAIAHSTNHELYAPPMFHILTGGLFLGAFFMATDMVTSPMSATGATIFGIGCGVITCVIRIWGAYPEGVSFSILFMNALTPLIDRYTANKPFGTVKKVEEAA